MQVRFRKVRDLDFDTLTHWIAQDPEHKNIGADFFARPVSLVIETTDSKPLIYLRMEGEALATVRLHIQFGPNRKQSAMGLIHGWPIFMQKLGLTKVRRLVFDSKSPALIGFCKRHFGFSGIPGTNDYELMVDKEPYGRAQGTDGISASRLNA